MSVDPKKLVAIVFGEKLSGTIIDQDDNTGQLKSVFFDPKVAKKVIQDFQEKGYLKEVGTEPRSFFEWTLEQEGKELPCSREITTIKEWEEFKKTFDEFKK